MINEKKSYWDEDILRIKNEVRRHDREMREGITDEETEPEETLTEATEETTATD